MKKLSRITALLIAVIMTVTLLSACVETPNGVSILITATRDTLEVGGEGIAVAVLATDGGTTTLTVDTEIVEIVDGNIIKIKSGATVTSDTTVTLTATLNSDPTVTATKQFTVKAPSNKPIISMSASANTINPTDTVTFATVSSDRGSITLSAAGANANLVEFRGNTMIVVGTVTMDTDITVVATLDSDPTVTAQKIITIKGPNAGAWIDLVADRYNIDSDNYAILTVTSYTGGAYTITTDADDNVIYYSASRMLRVYNDVTTAKQITVTATLNAEPTVKKSVTMTIVPRKVAPTIAISAKGNAIEAGKDLELTVDVSTEEDYVLSVSDSTIVEIVTKNGKDFISVKNDVQLAFDRIITVTATLRNDKTVSAQKNFVVKAPRTNGELNGKISTLTANTFSTLGAKSLTASGVLVDYYEDFNQSRNSETNYYDIVVKMEDGKWYGAWNVKGESNVNADTYIRSNEPITVDGDSGYIMKRVCVNKDNLVAYTNITDYRSVPTMWENQHLWNHFGTDSIDNYTYVEDQSTSSYDVYEFTADKDDRSVAFYLTYISFAYTPLLSDTLDRLYLKVNSDSEIIGIIGYTEYLYYGQDTREDADAMSYTMIEVNFTNVGDTTVPMPDVYDAPQYADKLQAALTNMSNATNYTFKAIDTITHAAQGDDGDYVLGSVSGSTIQTMSASGNYSSSTSPLKNGAIGMQGWITNGAILLENTSKYSYSMDDKVFRVENSGYKAKKIDGKDYYDHFVFDSALDAYKGDHQYLGAMTNVLPKWNFSPNVFEFVNTGTAGGDVTTYEFRLRDSAITREIAMQVSMYSNARDGASSAKTRFSIVVDDNGNVISTRYPYSLIQGTYLGYVTTTYSNIGSTTIDEGEFENYAPREINLPWSSYKLRYYYPDHSTLGPRDETATGETILNIMFADKWTAFPPRSVFTDAFGDSVTDLFFEYREITDANGVVIGYEDYFSMNADTDDYDENMQISDETYARIINALRDGLAEYDFEESYRSQTSGPADRTDRYVSFVNETLGCQIIVMNNHTKNFFLDIGKLGFWTFS